jgi:hypothetical protein
VITIVTMNLPTSCLTPPVIKPLMPTSLLISSLTPPPGHR